MAKNEITVVAAAPAGELSTQHAQLKEDMREFRDASHAQNTRSAYQSDWKHFVEWCIENRVASLPAEPATVAAYFTALAKGKAHHAVTKGKRGGAAPKQGHWKASSIDRRRYAIAYFHKEKGFEDPAKHPEVGKIMAGIRNTLTVAPDKKKPIQPKHLKATIAAAPVDARGTMVKAILLVGFSGALRRSEVVSLLAQDITFEDGDMWIRIRFRKGDQSGKGTNMKFSPAKDENLCPVRAMQEWMSAARVGTGPVFRSIDRYGNISDKALPADAVRRYVKEVVGAALGEEQRANYAGHSLRSGWITAAAKAGVPLDRIMKRSGHKSAQVAIGYIHEINQSGGENLL